jgi:dihydrofolate reductase
VPEPGLHEWMFATRLGHQMMGIEAALERAFDAADGHDVRIGGGVATIQPYPCAGLVDEMHIVSTPLLVEGGERLFDDLEGVELVSSPAVAHARFARKR